MIDDSMIDHVPLTTEESSFISSKFVHHCHFAKICSHLVKKIYSGRGPQLSLTQLEEIIAQLNILICNWRQAAISGAVGTDFSLTSVPFERKINESAIMLQYHELVLHIFCRAFIGNPPCAPNNPFLQDCQKTMVESACSILEIGNSLQAISCLPNR